MGGEFHFFLFECEFCNETRTIYLPKFYQRHFYILKFQKFMSVRNLKMLQQLRRFIYILYSKQILVPVNCARTLRKRLLLHLFDLCSIPRVLYCTS